MDRYLFQRKKLDEQYRIDMLVANSLFLNLKHVADINDSHVRQLLPYLEASIYEACPEYSRTGWLCC
ncbi:GxxExxY protein [candidate division KSB1 bacterium]|nr:GxxExxY protein [candidate division KSB1 bacterium]